MPDIKVSNKTSEVLNIGFRIVTPIAFINEVQPSQTISLHLASFLHGFEARRDNGFNRFSADESWRKAGELGGAIAAGTASVLAGTAWALGTFGRSGPLSSVALASAGAAWGAACQGCHLLLLSSLSFAQSFPL